MKVMKICKDIQLFVPNSKPSPSQILFSLNSSRRTNSSNLVKAIHNSGHGITYTNTLFLEDKLAEWSEKQSSLLPSNIKIG